MHGTGCRLIDLRRGRWCCHIRTILGSHIVGHHMRANGWKLFYGYYASIMSEKHDSKECGQNISWHIDSLARGEN
jgi:hypothetical protein